MRERHIHPDSESGGIPHPFGTSLSPHIGSAWQARHDNNNNKITNHTSTASTQGAHQKQTFEFLLFYSPILLPGMSVIHHIFKRIFDAYLKVAQWPQNWKISHRNGYFYSIPFLCIQQFIFSNIPSNAFKITADNIKCLLTDYIVPMHVQCQTLFCFRQLNCLLCLGVVPTSCAFLTCRYLASLMDPVGDGEASAFPLTLSPLVFMQCSVLPWQVICLSVVAVEIHVLWSYSLH